MALTQRPFGPGMGITLAFDREGGKPPYTMFIGDNGTGKLRFLLDLYLYKFRLIFSCSTVLAAVDSGGLVSFHLIKLIPIL